MSVHVLLCCLAASAVSATDPVGDVYPVGDPNSAAGGTLPDLRQGNAFVDFGLGEMRFEFLFAEPVYPADDYGHFDQRLMGYVDIDLDVPPVDPGNSLKSSFSGFASLLGIEAYVDLSQVMGGSAPLFDAAGSPVDSVYVPVVFADELVTITIPVSDLPGPLAAGDQGGYAAFAAYFYDSSQMTSDVFPNGDGYLFVTPEPASGVLLASALLWWASSRRASTKRRRC
ncbi:MAG TPA: hypothetical protein VMZ31_03100 [Phycisphaerae bacterium]|nr:hypothetical protein [Phycisphaerae bacterium]